MTQDFIALQKEVFAGEIHIVDLVRQALANIEATAHLNVFVNVYQESALAQANALDQKIKNGEKVGALAGCLISIKDVVCQEGKEISAASKILDGFVSPYSATAVARLIAEDAIVMGSTNCDAFGMGSENRNSTYGPTYNAIGDQLIPGGSSGGAAVSVQIDACMAAIGTDTGGSVRQPAALCGMYGFKPSYGRVSRHGLIAYASSFDQIGFLAKDARLIELIYDISYGPDDFDGTLVPKDQVPGAVGSGYVYFTECFDADLLQHEIRQSSLDWIAQLEQPSTAVSFDLLKYLVPTYYVLACAEASSNLSRFDGLRYGRRSQQSDDLKSLYTNSRTEGFEDETIRRILLGTYVLSEGYYDAYFQKAQQVRRLLTDAINDLFSTYEFLIMPVTLQTAWKSGEKNDDPVSVYMADINTTLANLVGCAAVSIPIGTDQNGLPFGIQILTKSYNEKALFACVHSFR